MANIISTYLQKLETKSTNKAIRKTEAYFKMMGYPYYNGNMPVIISQPYNGEKNAGELGAIKNYVPDFQSLSARSWQAYTESELAQIAINNYMLWVVGQGLKFKAEPEKDLIDNFDSNDFISLVEMKFNLHLKSKRSVNTRMINFHELVYEAKRHAIIGGDALIILDYGRPEEKNKTVSARLIDGYYLQTPKTGKVDSLPDSNWVSNGVEINQYGEPVAYHVLLDTMEYQRIEAYTKTGTLQAFLVYGLKYRVDFYRGMPLLSCTLEAIKKLDRYKEATVGGAEERAKIPLVVEHNASSTGEDPTQFMATALGRGLDPGTERITNDLLAKTASNIRYTTGKMSINAPIGATIKAPFDGKQETSFSDFYQTNFDIFCATLGIPPEVALNKYTTSFSSSRGANKNWEHRVNFERNNVSNEIYKPFYNFWLEIEIYNNRIEAEGYVVAKNQDHYSLIEAFQQCRFVGMPMPFIDPLKEVQAARAKLGDQTTPLATYEQVAEDLNLGDWEANILRASKEKKMAIAQGFEPQANLQVNEI